MRNHLPLSSVLSESCNLSEISLWLNPTTCARNTSLIRTYKINTRLKFFPIFIISHSRLSNKCCLGPSMSLTFHSSRQRKDFPFLRSLSTKKETGGYRLKSGRGGEYWFGESVFWNVPLGVGGGLWEREKDSWVSIFWVWSFLCWPLPTDLSSGCDKENTWERWNADHSQQVGRRTWEVLRNIRKVSRHFCVRKIVFPYKARRNFNQWRMNEWGIS